MAILTNKSDVIANFVRYHGRQPEQSDMATINYLTTKPPIEVEQLLAKNSPITGGLVWSEYQSKNQNQDSVDKTYADAVANNPVISKLVEGGNSVDDIINALETGNLSGVVDFNGQPFSPEDQQAALERAMKDNEDYYNQLQEKDKADAEQKLAQQQQDYQNYLINSGQQFEADKSELDQKAADRGVLFSGGRVQREKNMRDAYERDQQYTKDKVTRNIGGIANDFQYNYGSDAAGGLSQYYNLGGNTFNPNVARNGVNSSGISSVYNPGNYSYGGRKSAERSSDANVRAANYLKNKGNKLLSTGYQNQF